MRTHFGVRLLAALQALLLLGSLLVPALVFAEEPPASSDPTPTEQASEPTAEPEPEPTPAEPDPTTTPEPTAPEPTSAPALAPTITSDLDDYPPGGLVTLTGSNWAPGESVHIYVNDHAGSTWVRNVDVVADESGNVFDQFVLPDWFVASYQVVASGQTSVASHWFTDSNPQSIAVVAPTSRTVTQGSAGTYGTVTVTVGGNSNPCTVTYGVTAGLPAGATPIFTPTSGSTTGADLTTALQVTTTGATTPGTYSFRVTGTNSGAGCQGPGPTPGNPLTLIVNAANSAPVVTPAADQTATEGTGMSFTIGSFADAAGDTPWSASIDWGDASTDTTFNRTTTGAIPAQSHTYADNTTPAATGYTVTVSVTDTHGATGSGAFNVQVANVEPTLTVSGAASVAEGSTYSLTLGPVVDPGADTVSNIRVNWGDGTWTDGAGVGVRTHTYADGPANWTITVDITDEDGTFTDQANAFSVSVTNADPHFSPPIDQGGTEGTLETFALGTFSDPGDNDAPWTVSVDWGDGSTPQTFDVNAQGSIGTLGHQYDDEDTYTVTVTISDKDGGTDSGKFEVTIANAPPVVVAGADDTSDEGETKAIDLGSFTDAGVNDDPWTVAVDWGDGDSESFNASVQGALGTLAHTYIQDGTYTVTVTVEDEDGDSGSATFTVTVSNVAPDVAAGADDTIDEGDTFTGGGSFTDPGADTWTATVNYGEGAGVQTLNLTGKTFSLFNTYEQDGAYTVTVCVADDDTFDCDALLVTVDNVAPDVAAPADQTADEGSSTSFDLGSFGDPGVLDAPWTLSVDWGDGSAPDGGSLLVQGSIGSLSHTYDDDDTYLVTVTITDKDGDSGSASFDVVVANVAPRADLGNNGPINEGNSATISFSNPFDPSSADTSAGFHYAYSCTNGDLSGATYAGSSTSASTTCPFADNGTFTVKGRIIDKDGGFEEETTSVSVTNVEPTLTVSGAASVAEGSTYSLTLGPVVDPGADTVSNIRVNWGDGTWTDGAGVGVRTHTYADGPANWTITVDITDEDGTFTDQANAFSVSVTNVKPIPTLTAVTSSNPAACLVGNTVSISFAWTDPAGTNDTYSYVVDWGDGTNSSALSATSPVTGLSHSYAAGTYTIIVTVNDEDPGTGGSTSTSVSHLYNSSGFLQPINLGAQRSSFKIGSTIPVKVRITDCNGLAVTGLYLTVHLTKIDTSPEAVNEAVVASNPDPGILMRFSGDQYIFNLSTKLSQFNGGGDLTQGTYRLWVTTSPSVTPTIQAYIDTKK